MKKYSPSLAIKEMPVKTILRVHLISVSMATIKNTKNNKWWLGCWKKGNLIHWW
jgi:hypothetical protein